MSPCQRTPATSLQRLTTAQCGAGASQMAACKGSVHRPAGSRRLRCPRMAGEWRRLTRALWSSAARVPGGRALGSLASGSVVSHVAVSGTLLAGLRSGGRLGVWDVATGAVRHQVEIAGGSINGLALAPDGQRVAYVAEDGSTGVRILTGRGPGSQKTRVPSPCGCARATGCATSSAASRPPSHSLARTTMEESMCCRCTRVLARA